jgi:putative endonuclease
MFFVYIARCADNTLYVGLTADLGAREKTHNEGHGATYTAMRRPVQIIFSETFELHSDAVARERQLKRWTAAKKEALIRGELASLKGWSARARRRKPH